MCKHANVSQARLNLGENVKNRVVTGRKLNGEKWRFYGNNQCSLMNWRGGLLRSTLLKQLFSRLTDLLQQHTAELLFSPPPPVLLPHPSLSASFVSLAGDRPRGVLRFGVFHPTLVRWLPQQIRRHLGSAALCQEADINYRWEDNSLIHTRASIHPTDVPL